MSSHLEAFSVPGSFNPASMAFWVRVPQEAADSLIVPAGFNAFRCFFATVPFVTFGPQVTGSADGGETGLFPPSFIGMGKLDLEPPFGNPLFLMVNLICGNGSSEEGAFTKPDYYGNGELSATFESPGFPVFQPGEWHHIMVSWNIVGQQTDDPVVVGASQMYCFIDGVSKNGDDLPAMTNGHPGQNHMSHTITFATSSRPASSSGGPINGSPLCFPCATNAVTGPTVIPNLGGQNPFKKIEMGEFYLYNGRMLTEAAPFINGGKPAKRAAVFKALGDADLCLSGSGSWIHGKPKGKNSKSVKFTPSGEIKRYKPDPKIGG